MPKLRIEKIVAEHSELGRSDLRGRGDQMGAPLRMYGLRYAAYHLRLAGESELLWELLSCQGYQAEQTRMFRGRVGPAIASLREGIEVYAERGGLRNEDDARLCWLMLRCGEVVQQARTSLRRIFEEFRTRLLEDPQRLEDTLQRLQILDEPGFFLAGMLLLYIECERSREAGVALSVPRATRIVEAMEAKVWKGTKIEQKTDWLEEELVRAVPTELLLRVTDLTNFTDLRRLRLARVYAQAGRWDDALQAAGCQGEALVSIAGWLAQTGDLSRAMEVAEKNTEAWDRSCALGSIARATVQLQDKQMAVQVFGRALGLLIEIEDPYRRCKTIGVIGGELAQAGQFEGREECFTILLESAQGVRFPENQSAALGAIARALALIGEQNRAGEVFKDALVRIEGIADDYARSQSLAALGVALSEAGEFEGKDRVFSRVLELTTSIMDPEWPSQALGSIAQALANSGQKDEANRVFTLALELAGKVKNAISRDGAKGAIAKCLAQAGDWARASALYEGGETYSIPLEVFAEMVAAGELERATAVAHEIRHTQTQSVVLMTIAGVQFSRDRQRAVELAVESIELCGHRIDGHSIKLRTTLVASALAGSGDLESSLRLVGKVFPSSDRRYSDILKEIALELTRTGRLSLSLDVAGRIEDSLHLSTTLASIAQSLVQPGNVEARSEMLWRALELTNSIEDAWPQSVALGAIAGSFAKAGEMESGKNAFARALDVAGTIMDACSQAEAVVGIAVALTRVDEFDGRAEWFKRLLELAARIEAGCSQSKMRALLVKALAQAGESTIALGMAGGISHAGDQSKALAIIAESLAKAGVKDRARDAFNRSLQVARGIENPYDQSEAIESIAMAMITAGDMQHAKDLLACALETAGRIESEQFRCKALGSIAGSLAQAGEKVVARSVFSRALAEARGITNSYYQSEALASIACSMLQAREFHLAIEAADCIAEATHQSAALGKIAGALSKNYEANQDWFESIKRSAKTERSFDWLVAFPVLLRESSRPADWLRFCAGLCPSRIDITHSVISGLIAEHIRGGNMPRARLIAKRCPQLGLSEILA